MPTLPVAQMVMPSDLAGVTNGSVPAGLLEPCGVRSYYSPYGELTMHHLAARAMRAMVAAMCVSLGLDEVRADGTGRTYARQVQMFDGTLPANRTATEGRYLPEPLWAGYGLAKLTDDIRSWIAKRWRRRTGTASAAVPGTSNHGWWLAIDFVITPGMVDWLIANAARFGYSAEIQTENWHWRYVAGDRVPQAVLDFENPPSTSLTPLELLAMYQIALALPAGKLVCRVTAERIIHEINGAAEQVDVVAGVRQVTVTRARFLGMLAGGRATVGNPFVGVWYDAELDAAWQARRVA